MSETAADLAHHIFDGEDHVTHIETQMAAAMALAEHIGDAAAAARKARTGRASVGTEDGLIAVMDTINGHVAELRSWYRQLHEMGVVQGREKADPLVELERQYGEVLAEDDPEQDAEGNLFDRMVETPIASVAGVAAMARLLINSSKIGKSRHDEAAAAAILEWAGRQTGRNEFIGALNFEKVGVEPAQAEARP